MGKDNLMQCRRSAMYIRSLSRANVVISVHSYFGPEHMCYVISALIFLLEVVMVEN